MITRNQQRISQVNIREILSNVYLIQIDDSYNMPFKVNLIKLELLGIFHTMSLTLSIHLYEYNQPRGTSMSQKFASFPLTTSPFHFLVYPSTIPTYILPFCDVIFSFHSHLE